MLCFLCVELINYKTYHFPGKGRNKNKSIQIKRDKVNLEERKITIILFKTFRTNKLFFEKLFAKWG